ncbi:hypothetical protein Tco_0862063 [Tanacetum coccineum]
MWSLNCIKALQATSGQTSLGVTIKEKAEPQLINVVSASQIKHVLLASTMVHSESASGHDASATFTAEADLGNIDPKDSLPPQQCTNEGTINYSYDHFIAGTNPSVLSDDEAEVQTKTEDTSIPQPPPSPKSIKIQAEVANLRALPSYLNVQQITELLVNSPKPEFDLLIKAHDFSSHIQSELKSSPPSIPDKLDEFQTFISVLTTKVASLEGFKMEIPTEGQQIREKGKKATSHDEVDEEESDSTSNAESRPFGTLEDSSKSKPLKKFTYITKTGEKYQMTEEEIKNQKHIEQIVKADAARRVQGKITNCDMLTRGKGLINPKVYRDDGSSEIIHNFKTSDLHVGEWKRMMDACPKRTKKRKNVDDFHDYFKSTKRYKTSVQYGDLLAGTVLNDPALGMILFNAQHGQDFISIEDFAKLNNDMLYHVQENFFRLHQEPRMDDLARTFSSLLVAEVDKRNLNPNKQMRLIEKLRQLLNLAKIKKVKKRRRKERKTKEYACTKISHQERVSWTHVEIISGSKEE